MSRYQQKMKKYLPLIIISILIIYMISIPAHIANASLGDSIAEAIFNRLGYFVLTLASAFLSICGLILNMSINITIQIKDFVDSTPAIYVVWRSIRDITGMFIIFSLLFMAFQMILDLKRPGFGEIMKNIIIAGVLINFSFFIVSVLIDASNIVSVQLFKQLTPNVLPIKDVPITSLAQESMVKGSISDVFMNSLNLTQLYKSEGIENMTANTGDRLPNWIRIAIVSFAGAGMMITAGLSFLFASLAFIIRLAILVFLLGFSPIWFAAYIIPQLKEYANKGWKLLSGQLIFMPAYLLLMYMALQVVNGTNFTESLGVANTNFYFSFFGLIANCVFVIIMLNLPLLAALKLGAGGEGIANQYLNKLGGKIGAGAMWSRAGGLAKSATVGTATTAGGVLARGTIGAGAMSLDKKLSNSRFFGDTVLGKDIRGATTGALAKKKFGTKRSAEEYSKEKKVAESKKAEFDRRDQLGIALKDIKPGAPPVIRKDPKTGEIITVENIIGKMNTKERLALGADNLKNIEVIKRLGKDDFEAIMKSEDISDADKKSVMDNREKALNLSVNDAVTSGNTSSIENMVKNLNGPDLLKIATKNPGMVSGAYFVPFLNAGQLDYLDKNGLDQGTKTLIANKVLNQITSTTGPRAGRKHAAAGYINRNIDSWT
jgi:hypothetical protein